MVLNYRSCHPSTLGILAGADGKPNIIGRAKGWPHPIESRNGFKWKCRMSLPCHIMEISPVCLQYTIKILGHFLFPSASLNWRKCGFPDAFGLQLSIPNQHSQQWQMLEVVVHLKATFAHLLALLACLWVPGPSWKHSPEHLDLTPNSSLKGAGNLGELVDTMSLYWCVTKQHVAESLIIQHS